MSSSESTSAATEDERTTNNTPAETTHSTENYVSNNTPAETTHSTNYLNPLTMICKIFYKNFERYQKKHNKIDAELYKALLNITEMINKFVDQSPEEIHEDDKRRLMELSSIKDFRQMFICNKCNAWYSDAEKMASHIGGGHQTAQKLSRRQRNRKNREKKQELQAQIKELQEIIDHTEKIDLSKNESRADNARGIAQNKVENKKDKKLAKNKNDLPNLPLPKKIRSHLNHNYDAFFKDSVAEGDALVQIEEYEVIERNLLEQLQASFQEQQVRVYKFGSRLCGIGTRNSDLDLFVAIGDSFNVFENRGSKKTTNIIAEIRKALPRNGVWARVNAVDKARVPIVKAIHVPTGIECDIVVSNSLGFCNTELQKYLFDLQPIARHLAIYMKKWLARSKLNELMSTYSMNLMIIYFLQTKKILPSIETLQSNLREKSYVGPWISNFKHASLAELNLSPCPTNIQYFKKILKEFFEFLADFKYETYIMSPYYGRLINFYSASMDMPKHYLEYVANKDADHHLSIAKPMVVQDPIQLNHNVAKGVSKNVLMKFKTFLRGSANLIEVD